MPRVASKTTVVTSYAVATATRQTTSTATTATPTRATTQADFWACIPRLPVHAGGDRQDKERVGWRSGYSTEGGAAVQRREGLIKIM